jgi:NADH dehydrogenase
VIVVDKQNHHLFQPLLYQVATAALSPGNIAVPIRKVLGSQRNCQVVMAEVTDVDLERSTVTLVDEPYRYDYLVLAAGVETNYFGREDWSDDAPGLKTIDEAIDVRARFLLAFEQAEIEDDPDARRAALTFAIVGAGPTGVEMAGAIAECARHTLRRDFRHFDARAIRVLLIDAEDRVLPGFHRDLSRRAERDLDGLGVETMFCARVVEVDPRGVAVDRAGQRTRIDANNVIWAAGVEAVALGRKLGVETDRAGRVVVRDDLTIPGHSNVFVVGDLARRIDPKSGEPVPGVAQGALQMGRFAGRAIRAETRAAARGAARPKRGIFVYRDKGSMATIGRAKAVAEIHGLHFGGMLAFLLWALIHILFLIDFRNRITTLAEWIWLFFFYERGVRLITGEGRAPRPVRPHPDDPHPSPPPRSDSP